MKRALAVLVLVATAHPALADPQPPYEVIRADDSGLSCEQLRGEINDTTRTVQAVQDTAAKGHARGRMAKGVLGGLASGALAAAPSLLGARGGGVGAYAAQAALNSAVSTAQRPAEPEPATPAAPSLPQQRLDHLNDLHARKGC